MDFILIILLFLIVYLIILPLFRVGSAVYKTRKQMRNFFDGMNGAGTRQQQAHQQPEPRKKKFNSTDGEYVDFEEIESAPTQQQANTGTHKDYSNSSQIEDAEWEDVK